MAGSKRAKRGATTFFITLGSVLTAFVLSCLVLLVAGYNPLQAFSQMIVGVFSRPKYIAWTLLKAQPIILTGLSVAFAFKTGLFNIGAEGQFIAGMTAASLLGYLIHMPAVFPEWLSLIVHPTIVLALSMLVAGLYGGLVGLFKARFGMHEVISGIMLNWIAFYLHNAVVAAPFFSEQINKSYPVQPTASMVLFESWKKTAEGNAFFEGIPWLDEIFSTPINVGLIWMVLLLVAVSFLLNRTRLGFELRAVGGGQDAAEHSGIPIGRRMIVAMAISGALAGAAGATQLLGITTPHRISHLAAAEGYGFNGIAVALMGNSSPLGCLLAGLFFAVLQYGGTKMSAKPAEAPPEVINIMIGIIMLCMAAPRIFQMLMMRRATNKGGVKE